MPQDAEVERLFRAAVDKLRDAPARVPLATYRVQLSRELTFADALAQLDYLYALGVSDLYCSPFFKAQPESMHGYDIVDHNQLNPAIGTREELERLSAALHARDMGLLVDFVPNHMGIGSDANLWWMDVLENGPSSLYARHFDIDWTPLKSELEHKVLLPVLGDHYGSVLENGDLRICFDAGSLWLEVYDKRLPVNPRTYPVVLEPMLPELTALCGPEHDAVLELQSILTGLGHLPPRTETLRAKVVERRREKEILKRRLATLVAESPEVARALEESIRRANGRRGDPRSFDALDSLLEAQAYRLSFWRVAGEEVNYRRFFEVNELAAIRMENPAVFEAAHRLLFELITDGLVTGLRIDHPDGLWDPLAYFRALEREYVLGLCRRELGPKDDRAAPPARTIMIAFDGMRSSLGERYDRALAEDPRGELARPLYIVVEKILSRGERLPEDWPVYGTSGYDFAATLTALFVDGDSERAITDIYERFIGQRIDFATLVYQKKKLILQTALSSELNVLAHVLDGLSERDRYSRDFTLGSLTDALREVIACFPVYRTYVTERTEQVSEHDRVAVTRAIHLARRRNPASEASIYAYLAALLTLDVPERLRDEDRAAWRELVMKFQQLSGAVMAKGVEDTAFYIYNRLVALNEVGGEPEHFGIDAATFHRRNDERLRSWPGTLNASSTHDTKRSEDVRARIGVLSEIPESWGRALEAMAAANAPYRMELEGQRFPDPNDEYLLYQTLLGTWPFQPPTGAALAEYTERIVAYMRKATKEAKVNTSWVNADPEYDGALEEFVRRVLAEEAPFRGSFLPLARTVAYHGMWSSLSQLLVKLTSPGVPDTYQGNEVWDFSLVDPDNRRPVDFGARRALLEQVHAERGRGVSFARALVERPEDGRIKLFTLHVGLELRRRRRELFDARSSYRAIAPVGERAAYLVAFARASQAGAPDALLTVVPRLTARLVGERREPPLGSRLAGTKLPVAAGRYRNLFTGAVEEAEGAEPALLGERVLRDFPVALLERLQD